MANPIEESDIDPRAHLHREFKERHVSMIAVAGAIGTGLIIGSGTGLVRGGPASLLIAYSIIGLVVYFLMTALGEMASMLPTDKGFAGYATRFVDPALGYVSCQYVRGAIPWLLFQAPWRALHTVPGNGTNCYSTATRLDGTISSNMQLFSLTTSQQQVSLYNTGVRI